MLAPETAGEEAQASWSIFGANLAQFRNNLAKRLFPRSCQKISRSTRPGPPERSLHSIRMVSNLQPRLPACAEPPLVDRVIRVALQFLGKSHLDGPKLPAAYPLRLTRENSDHQ